MTTHPNCKINIGLHVTSRRADGYHELETVFMPILLCDTLTIEPADDFRFTQSGIVVDCPAEENICVKAYRLMRYRYPQIGDVLIHLEKNIPFGAGLGGGSSDAAHVITMLNELFDIGLGEEAMCQLAKQIGADCPFFILNRPCYATGIGDQLEPLNFQLSTFNFQLILLKPTVSVSTADAYRGITPHPSNIDLRKAINEPVEDWRNLIVNDFEATVFPKYPIIAELKEMLYERGAVYTSMSGSGSAIFGLFKDPPKEKLPFEIYRSNDF